MQNAKNIRLHVQNAQNIKTACAECPKHKNCMCRMQKKLHVHNAKNIKTHVQNAKNKKTACAEC
jgi:hypothetical protein